MRKISNHKRSQAVKLLKKGLSVRQVAQEVGIGKSTVAKLRKSTSADLPTPTYGRKKKLHERHEAWINRFFLRNPKTTLRRACQEFMLLFKIKITPSMLRNVLRFQHFRARKIIKKPKLEPRHIKARLDFALAHKDWTANDWHNVIWSDETKINRLGSDGKQHCWIQAAGLNSSIIRETLKYNGGNIMVWGSMTYKGVGTLHVFQGRMTADMYIDILEANLLPTMHLLGTFNDVQDPIFQQDNDPKHTAYRVYDWFNDRGIQVLDWPAQSPDLNPIEHLWTELKKRIYQYNTPAAGMVELERRMREKWAEIPVTVCQTLIDSMPRRIEAVIKAKGRQTKY